MKEFEIEKMLEEELPSIPSGMDSKKAIEYVGLVYKGIDKVDAYKQVFPERCDRITKKALSCRRDVRATIMHSISVYEQGKYVSSLYSVGSKHYFMQFVDKRTRMLEELFNIGMNQEEDIETLKRSLIVHQQCISDLSDRIANLERRLR
jgi:excinuclease UvrABC ATPase subunit